MIQNAVARYRGLCHYFYFVILGLAPQALCFRTLRGLLHFYQRFEGL